MTDRLNLTLASVALFLLVVADVASTVVFRGRGIPESNPLVAPWVDHTATFITVKVGLVGMFLFGVWALSRHVRHGWMARWIWVAAGIVAVAVVVNIGALI